jgi:hypothetical protein
MLHAYVERFDMMDRRGNILSWDEQGPSKHTLSHPFDISSGAAVPWPGLPCPALLRVRASIKLQAPRKEKEKENQKGKKTQHRPVALTPF